jgi:hypothetical protein
MLKPQVIYFMQDNVSGHAATNAKQDICDRGIHVIY